MYWITDQTRRVFEHDFGPGLSADLPDVLSEDPFLLADEFRQSLARTKSLVAMAAPGAETRDRGHGRTHQQYRLLAARPRLPPSDLRGAQHLRRPGSFHRPYPWRLRRRRRCLPRKCAKAMSTAFVRSSTSPQSKAILSTPTRKPSNAGRKPKHAPFPQIGSTHGWPQRRCAPCENNSLLPQGASTVVRHRLVSRPRLSPSQRTKPITQTKA